jgi:aspartyl-tRNA(Asn)/glutamyl-tRNA(Gln) amidotransferase subunit C
MSSPITRETLEHLARLARLELDGQEEERLLRDLQNILNYFEELSELKTDNIETPIEEISHKNVSRGDTERQGTNQGRGADQFPRRKDGYLEVPHVFE